MQPQKVPVDKAFDEDGSDVYLIMVSTLNYEVNIRIPPGDIHKLKQVPSTPWIHGSIYIGKSANAPVYWATGEDKNICMLLGDDQSWDIAFNLPVDIFDDIIKNTGCIEAM